MTKTQIFVREIRQKRRQISRLQEDLTDMLDHFAIVEARAKNVGNFQTRFSPLYTASERLFSARAL